MSIRDWWYDLLTGGEHSREKEREAKRRNAERAAEKAAEERLEAQRRQADENFRNVAEAEARKNASAARQRRYGSDRMRQQIANDVPLIMQQPIYTPPSSTSDHCPGSHSSASNSCSCRSSCSGSSSCSSSSSSCGGGGD